MKTTLWTITAVALMLGLTGAAHAPDDHLVKVGRVLTSGPAGSWDSVLVESAHVVRDPERDRWAMFYTGYGRWKDTVRGQIGVAYSRDLKTWHKRPRPVLRASAVPYASDEYGVSCAVVTRGAKGLWHLYYCGFNQPGYEGGERGTPTLHHATAASLNGPWTRHGQVIDVAGDGWRSTAVYRGFPVRTGGQHYLFFNATAADRGTETIGYATAPSWWGPWTVHDRKSPVLRGTRARWDAHKVADPTVFRRDGRWYMHYFGYDGTTAGDGIATTTDKSFPLGWRKSPTNPVLTPGRARAFDGQLAHKPSIVIANGKLYHFYTAVDMKGRRSIGLAVAG